MNKHKNEHTILHSNHRYFRNHNGTAKTAVMYYIVQTPILLQCLKSHTFRRAVKQYTGRFTKADNPRFFLY